MYFMIEYCRNFISTHERYVCIRIACIYRIYSYCAYCQRKMWMFQSTLSVRIDNVGRRRRRRRSRRKKHELACARELNSNHTNNNCSVMTLFQTKLIYHVCHRSIAGLYSAAQKKRTTNFPSLPFHTTSKTSDGFRGDLFLVWNEFLSILTFDGLTIIYLHKLMLNNVSSRLAHSQPATARENRWIFNLYFFSQSNDLKIYCINEFA